MLLLLLLLDVVLAESNHDTGPWELVVTEREGDRYSADLGELRFRCSSDNGADAPVWYRFVWQNKFVEFEAPHCIFGVDLRSLNIPITNVVTNTNVGIGRTAKFCKACSTQRMMKDTCWGITSDDLREDRFGCNAGGWNGVGVYYGVESHSDRSSGGFAGEKTTGQVKGTLASVGLRVYQCKYGPCTTALLFRRLPEMIFNGVVREGGSVDADDTDAGVVKGQLGFDAQGIQGNAPRSVLFDVKYAETDRYMVFLSLGLPADKQAFNVRTHQTLKSYIVEIGPYLDTSNRALRYGPRNYGYTAETCRAACPEYKYFALQDDGWCCCDNDLTHATKYGKSTCGKTGGSFCNYIYASKSQQCISIMGYHYDTNPSDNCLVRLGDNTWHSVAVTYDGAELRIVIDGMLAYAGTAGSSSYNTQGTEVILGRSNDIRKTLGSRGYFVGRLRNVRVYKGVTSVPLLEAELDVKHYKKGGGLTWSAGDAYCRSIGTQLCARSELCRLDGSATAPFGRYVGEQESRDMWVPVRDETNNWVQIGSKVWPTCSLHTELSGELGVIPSWSEHAGGYGWRDSFFCCHSELSPTLSFVEGGTDAVLLGVQSEWQCPKSSPSSSPSASSDFSTPITDFNECKEACRSLGIEKESGPGVFGQQAAWGDGYPRGCFTCCTDSGTNNLDKLTWEMNNNGRCLFNTGEGGPVENSISRAICQTSSSPPPPPSPTAADTPVADGNSVLYKGCEYIAFPPVDPTKGSQYSDRGLDMVGTTHSIPEGFVVPAIQDDDFADVVTVIKSFPWWTHWMHVFDQAWNRWPPYKTRLYGDTAGDKPEEDSKGYIEASSRSEFKITGGSVRVIARKCTTGVINATILKLARSTTTTASSTTTTLATTATTRGGGGLAGSNSSTNKTSSSSSTELTEPTNPVTNNSSKRGGTTAAILIVVLLLVGVGVFFGRRQWLAHTAKSNRREQAILELNGGGGMGMVENPLAHSASRTLPTVPTYENVAEQQLQPANDRADVPPPLIPGSRHGAPRAAEPQLYSTPADLDPVSLYKSPADVDGTAAGVQSQVQVQVYSVPTDRGNVDLYQPADGGHAYAESSTFNNGGNAGGGGGAEYATVHEDDDGVYSNA